MSICILKQKKIHDFELDTGILLFLQFVQCILHCFTKLIVTLLYLNIIMSEYSRMHSRIICLLKIIQFNYIHCKDILYIRNNPN
jgi:hypothetical protein